MVPGADLRFASISNPETRPAALSRETPEGTPFRLISEWDYEVLSNPEMSVNGTVMESRVGSVSG